ncbi:hypothetical protein Hdeb2414_s0020g00566361 [Helianthus debilis subsp. tardiflorus]
MAASISRGPVSSSFYNNNKPSSPFRRLLRSSRLYLNHPHRHFTEAPETVPDLIILTSLLPIRCILVAVTARFLL